MHRLLLLLVVTIAVSVTAVAGDYTNVNRCTRTSAPLPLHTYINGCVDPPCRLPQEEYARINITFEALHNHRSLETRASARVSDLNLWIPYPLGSDGVTCNFLVNSRCPLTKGEIQQYILNFYIQTIFPLHTHATVEFSVQDQDRRPVFCLSVSILITEPRRSIDKHFAGNATAHIV